MKKTKGQKRNRHHMSQLKKNNRVNTKKQESCIHVWWGQAPTHKTLKVKELFGTHANFREFFEQVKLSADLKTIFSKINHFTAANFFFLEKLFIPIAGKSWHKLNL